MASITKGGLNSFMPPSISKNRTDSAVRMRLAQIRRSDTPVPSILIRFASICGAMLAAFMEFLLQPLDFNADENSSLLTTKICGYRMSRKSGAENQRQTEPGKQGLGVQERVDAHDPVTG